MLRTITLIVISLALLYILGGLLLFAFQKRFIYFPTPATNHNYEEIEFNIHGENIKVIAVEKSREKALLYFGGNAESIAASAAELALNLPDYSIYLVNYRGYGGSSGTPSEQALYQDALLIFETLRAHYRTLHVVGRSLGSGIASYLAATREVDKLVLVTPFDSIEHIAQAHYPFYPVSLLLTEKYDSVSRVAGIKAPTLVLAASDDDVIPSKHTQRLVNHFKNTIPTFITLAGTQHNTISNKARYYDELQDFLD